MTRAIAVAIGIALIAYSFCVAKGWAAEPAEPPQGPITLSPKDMQNMKDMIGRIQHQALESQAEADKWKNLYEYVHECAKMAAHNGLPILPCFNYDTAAFKSKEGRGDLTED